MAKICLLPVILILSCSAAPGVAADWSDTAISVRAGNDFREPFNPDDIGKTIYALTHVSGYDYGTNFFNVDLLESDSKDPASLNSTAGAQEAYVVYRNTLDLGKVFSTPFKWGYVRDVGATIGFDWNTKNDVSYNSRKRMLVAGPTLMWDVPGSGFFNTSLLLLDESNAPSGAYPPISGVKGRYTYKLHPMLAAFWALPLSQNSALEGYADLIAPKGKDEVGRQTGTETNIDMQVMVDLGSLWGASKNRFRGGVEYQYWNNKFGNTSTTTDNVGQRASTPMVRVEYHF